MKAPTLVISTVLVSLLAVSQSGVINDDNVSSYSLIDPIIKSILEKMRPKLANLKFNDVKEEIRNPRLNATIIANGITVQNADKFVINNLKSTLVPLKLTNVTLTWDNILAKASYDVDARLTIPEINVPTRLYAKGDARVALKGIFLTVGANMELKDKVPQIKPKGLFGFDINIRGAEVTLTSLMGSPEFGKAIGEFLSRFIPDAVNTLKKPLFDAFHDTIVAVLNEVLKSQASFAMDEMPELSSEELDSVEESDFFPGAALDNFFKEIDFEAEV